MKLPNKETFCVAPWFQIRNENNGRKQVCCNILSEYPESVDTAPLDFLNSKDNQKLKKQLHDGVRAEPCVRCWHSEDNGVTSLRQKLNGVLTKNTQNIENTWLQTYFNQKTDYISDDILMSDIKIGNTCNHACVMCVPDDSSMIYNEWRNKPNAFFIKEKLQKDPGYLDRIKNNGYKNQQYRKYVEQILDNHNLKFLKLIGGEPLLDQYLLNKLSKLPDTQKRKLSLYIVTNGSKDLALTRKELGNFRSIMFTVSIEGIGELQEYARYGSRWSEVSRNILNFKKHYPSDINIHHTMQTTTILGFGHLAEWITQNDLSLSIGLVDDPDYMTFASLPDHAREQVRVNISKLDLEIKQNNIGDEKTVSLRNLVNMMDTTPFNTDLYEKFKKYIEWYEQGKNVKSLKDTFPLLFVDSNR